MKYPARYLLGFVLLAASCACMGHAMTLHRRAYTLASFGYLAENAMDGRVECRDHLETDGDWYTLYRANGEPAWCELEGKP